MVRMRACHCARFAMSPWLTSLSKFVRRSETAATESERSLSVVALSERRGPSVARTQVGRRRFGRGSRSFLDRFRGGRH